MRSRVLLDFSCLAFLVALSTPSSPAQSTLPAPQQAQVTFYSSGSAWSQLPGEKHGLFSGRIMDGKNQLAMLLPERFVTFNLDPGQHTLTATSWMASGPAGGGHLKINLLAGQHY
jgi:hypothetical protein